MREKIELKCSTWNVDKKNQELKQKEINKLFYVEQ